MTNNSYYGRPSHEASGPSQQPPAYHAPTHPPPTASGPHSEPANGLGHHKDQLVHHAGQPGGMQHHQYGVYAPPPGGPTQGPTMQHSASYGPPAAQYHQQYQGPPLMMAGPYHQNGPYGQHPQQNTDRGAATGFCGTCCAVMCGVCAADALCEICF